MSEWINYLPIAIIILATIQAAIVILFKKEKTAIKIIVFLVLVALCILQIRVNIFNKTKEDGREHRDMIQKIVLNQKIGVLKKGVDSLTSVVIFKEDGIKSFIEAYLLKDSAMRAKYDSFNKIDRQKGHPELVILNPKLYKIEDRYVAGYTLENRGERPAINIYLKEFVVSSVWDMYEKYGNVTLPAPSTLEKGLDFNFRSFHNVGLILYNFNYPTYYYIEGTYCDADFKSMKYPFSELFSTIRSGYNLDSSNLTICRPWEKSKIKAFIERY